MKKNIQALGALLLAASPVVAADPQPAATAINQFGLDLQRELKGQKNLCISPYSSGVALAMTYAGAKGETATQMAKVLRFGKGEPHESFAALNALLEKTAGKSITLAIANRLFGQEGFEFRKEFLALVKEKYSAPLEVLDFAKSEKAAKTINGWVEKQTRDRIKDLIGPGVLDAMTRLVLVNALYLKADWEHEFDKSETMPRPFHVDGKKAEDVPTMQRTGEMGYMKKNGFSAVTLPYVGGSLQFLVLVPDEIDGLASMESRINAELLNECAKLEQRRVDLTLPKLKLAGPTVQLKEVLVKLGMKAAFDIPTGSANFEGIAPKTDKGYLYISDVLHKTFLEVDEKGTEAAAATAVVMKLRASAAVPDSVEVRVDRPFAFAVQEKSTGVCLFLGRISNPK